MPKLADVLFDDLRSSKKNINRIISAGLLFAFIAHFYVVEPYFECMKREKTITESLNNEENEYKALLKQSQNIMVLNQEIDKLLSDFNGEIGNLSVTLDNLIDRDMTRNPSHAGCARPNSDRIDSIRIWTGTVTEISGDTNSRQNSTGIDREISQGRICR